MESVCGVAHGPSFSAESGLQAIKEVTEDGLFFYLLGSPAIPAGAHLGVVTWCELRFASHLALSLSVAREYLHAVAPKGPFISNTPCKLACPSMSLGKKTCSISSIFPCQERKIVQQIHINSLGPFQHPQTPGKCKHSHGAQSNQSNHFSHRDLAQTQTADSELVEKQEKVHTGNASKWIKTPKLWLFEETIRKWWSIWRYLEYLFEFS